MRSLVDDSAVLHTESAEALDLRRYLSILRRHASWLLLATALGALVGTVYVQLVTPVYRATATLLIQPQQSNVVSIEELVGIETQNADYYKTQFVLLRSRSLARKVITALDLWESPELSDLVDDEVDAEPALLSRLYIDADMRRPALLRKKSSSRRRHRNRGLSSYLSDSLQLEDVIFSKEIDGQVDLMPSGPVPALPLELLSSEKLESLIQVLRTRYDRIIIDSPPVRAVPDAMVLSKQADAVLYVVKAHETSLTAIRGGLRRLKIIGAPILGVVMTQFRPNHSREDEGDHYYSGYHDLGERRARLASRHG